MQHVPWNRGAKASGPDVGAAIRHGHYVSLVASLLYVLVILVLAYRESAAGAAVYALSFWHYYVYFLACVFAAVSLEVLKRDAMVIKSVAIIALFYVYLAAPLDALSFVVVGSGFLLNIAGAMALGADRTYYGHEIAGLPHRKIEIFPYSVMSHPMLVGNVIAYAGTLLNADFRRSWWPLACTHIALNVGLLVMENVLATQSHSPNGLTRESVCRMGVAIIGLIATSSLGAGMAFAAGAADPLTCGLVVVAGGAFAYALLRCYR